MSNDEAINNNIDPIQKDQLRQDINDEIADHLRCAQSEVKDQFENENELVEYTKQRFGDVKKIKRQCWWIHKGDEIMLRTATISIAVLLAITIGVVCVGGWQVTQKLDNLTLAIERLGNSPPEVQLVAAEDKSILQITGSAYLGEKTKPAINAEIQIWRQVFRPKRLEKSETIMVSLIKTDKDGKFASGNLAPGEYFIIAPLIGNFTEGTAGYYQSKELAVYAFNQPYDNTFDLKAETGKLEVNFINPPPKMIEQNGHKVDVKITSFIRPAANSLPSSIPFDPSNYNEDWQGKIFGAPYRAMVMQKFSDTWTKKISNSPVTANKYPFCPLIEGEYYINVELTAVLKKDREDHLVLIGGNSDQFDGGGGGSFGNSSGIVSSKFNLSNDQSFKILANKLHQVEIDFPKSLEQNIRKLLERKTITKEDIKTAKLFSKDDKIDICFRKTDE